MPKRIASIADLTPDSQNANRGTERGRGMLEASLRKHGAGRSVLADKHGTLIAGNKTVESAAELGMPVREIHTDGKELVVVVRDDLDLGTDKAARELAYADNRVSQVSLEWELAQIGADVEAGIDLSAMFTTDELAALLDQDAGPTEGLTDPDAVPGVPDAPITQPGDLWVLGRHRLLCGDSTVATDVDRLLDGATPTLMVTDPPYGVEYEPDWRSSLDSIDRATNAVLNDDRIDWREAWALVPVDVVYCWHADRHASAVQQSLESADYQIRSQIIWAKPHFALSRGHYHWQHEPCWYAVRKGATAHWVGDHKQTTVWEVDNGTFQGSRGAGDESSGHGTQKPVECMARPIRNHAGDVYDPFLGSGTTLIAAEMHGRACYGMEISPAYCDVIVNRWEAFTGGQAVRLAE